MALLFLSMGMLGMGNGGVFQMAPQRFPAEIELITGIVGAAGGLGGFLLPSLLGLLKDLSGSYATGLLLFAMLVLRCCGHSAGIRSQVDPCLAGQCAAAHWCIRIPRQADGQNSAGRCGCHRRLRHDNGSEGGSTFICVPSVRWRRISSLFHMSDVPPVTRWTHKVPRQIYLSMKILEFTRERIDLLRQLEESAKKMAEGGAVEITVCNACDPRLLRPPAATALLRIGQEAIANAIRHADPIHLRIALSYDMEGVSLSVTDDGIGFIESGDLLGFGLRGMRRRAASVSGVLEISSTLGSGTQIRVFVPSQSAFAFSGIRRSLQRHVWERILHAYSGR